MDGLLPGKARSDLDEAGRATFVELARDPREKYDRQ